MRLPIYILVAALAVSGCSRSSTNVLDPRTWFGGSSDSLPSPSGAPVTNEVDNRILVAQVLEARIDPTPGGVIVRAVGLPPTQGYWDADIVRVRRPSDPADVMRYEFRLRPPVSPQPVGSERSRIINVADFISTVDLEPIRRVTVVGASNSISRSR